MSFPSIGRTLLAAAATIVSLSTLVTAAVAGTSSTTTGEQPFLSANDGAMTKMMGDMTIKPTGDIAHDFVSMMVPHHQGAIDMAEIELHYGHNPLLQRICQEIIAEQLQEIAAMRIAVGEHVSPYEAMLAGNVPSLPAQAGSGSSPPIATGKDSVKSEQPFLRETATAMNKMMSDMTIRPTGDIDRDFVAMMIPHHQGAIDMAQAELRYGRSSQLRPIVQEIIVDQQKEITMMRLAVGEALPPSTASPTSVSSAPSTSPMSPPMRMQMSPNK